MTFTFGNNFTSLLSQNPGQFYSRLIELTNSLNQLKYGVGSNSSFIQQNKNSSDDPLGMGFRLNSRVYGQAASNASDALTAVSSISTSLSRQGQILTQLKDLATTASSSSTTLDSRLQLNATAATLVDEYNSLNVTTSYNKLKLMDGSLSSFDVQLGYGSNQYTVTLNRYTTRQVGSGYGKTDFSAVASPYGAATQGFSSADTNGDGRDDVLTQQTPWLSHNVSIAISGPTGVVGAGTETKVVLTGLVNNSKFADVDGNGVVDVLAATSAGIEVAYGNGDGTFGASQILSAGNFGSVNLTDISGDGTSDVTAVASNGDVTALVGAGGGSFSASTISTGIAGVTSSTVGDINGDGYSDLAFINSNGDLYSLLGAADGSLASPTLAGNVGGGTGTFELSSAQLNGDGRLDFVVAGPLTAAVFFGQADNTISTSARFDLAVGADQFAISDLNGDGHKDILARLDSSNVAIYSGDGTGKFSSSTFAFDSSSIGVADLNGDGVSDLVGQALGYYSSAIANTKTTTAIPYLDLTSKQGGSQALSALDSLQTNLDLETASIHGTTSVLTSAISTLTKTATLNLATADRLKEAYVNRYTSPYSALFEQANAASALIRALLA